jgi:histone-lysine N-methyltransferase SETMAR
MKLYVENGLNFGQMIGFHHDNAPAHKMLSVKQFPAQKLINEMEHPPFSPDLALNDFWLFSKIKSALKG